MLSAALGCAEKFEHDLELAAKRAQEFADTTFVRRNLERGYELQADKARAYVPLDKFMDKVNLMHRGGYPIRIRTTGAAPVKGEKLVNVSLRGDGDGQFSYQITLAGTAAADYRVVTFTGGQSP
jgi:hypothetical protein